MAKAERKNTESWSVALNEKASCPPDKQGSYWTSTHVGGGSLRRIGDGIYEGKISFAETSRVVDHASIPLITTMAGAETWKLTLTVSGKNYTLLLSTFSRSGTVKGETVEENTGRKNKFKSYVNWAIFGQIEGTLRDGADSGSYSATKAKDGCIGTLEWSVKGPGVEGPTGGGGGESPGTVPGTKPKKDDKRIKCLSLAKTICSTPDSCGRYRWAVAEFNKLGSWLGPPGTNVEFPNPKSPSLKFEPLVLRMWWEDHGCIRCFLKAWNKMNRTKEWVAGCESSGKEGHPSKPQVVLEIEKAIESWNSKNHKLPGKYYCSDCVETLDCGIALYKYGRKQRTEGGHTAWAYQIPTAWRNETLYSYPADEDHGGGGDETGLWRVGEKVVRGGGREITFSDAREFYRSNEFVAWKPLRALDGNFEEAFLVGWERLSSLYVPLVNDCNQAAYAVLTAFGSAHIPSPKSPNGRFYIPSRYFAAVDANAEWFIPEDPPPRERREPKV